MRAGIPSLRNPPSAGRPPSCGPTLLALLILACGGEDPGAGGSVALSPPAAGHHPLSFHEAFEVLERTPLEENERVLTVAPFAVPGRDGRILITDRVENQVRLYDREGALIWHAGREGDGPGELNSPRPAALLGDRVAAVDVRSRLTLWDPSRDSVAVEHLPARHVAEDLDALPRDRLLLSTRTLRPGLLIWDVGSRRLERTFFEPFIPEAVRPFYVSLIWIRSDVRNDLIASTVSIHDTLYIHDDGGGLRRMIPLGLQDVRLPESTEGLGRNVRLSAWMEELSMVMAPAWYGEGRVAIWIRDRGSRGHDLRFSLLLLDPTSGESALVTDVPHFLFAEGRDFHFLDPDVPEQNVILRARLREGVGP